MHPIEWLQKQRYIWREGLFWFQRRPPAFEFRARLYVGRAGSGKTLFATRDAIKLLRRGVVVVSNYRIWDRLSGRESVPIASWTDVLRWSVWAIRNEHPVVFVIDEIHMWAPSRFYQLAPAWFLGLLAQHRHYGVGIIGTTQNLQRCEVVLRELVYAIVFVRHFGMVPERVPQYAFCECDPAKMNDYSEPPVGSKYQLMGGYVPWWVFGGYSTRELMAVNEWQDDEETRAEIQALTDEARSLVIPKRPEWFRELEAIGLDLPEGITCAVES